MARRAEFSAPTKREAHLRSGGVCEAVGPDYGLPTGQRCGNGLNLGVEYDHLIEATLGGDNSLSNCRAICPACHRHKTSARAGELAKTKRIADKRIKARGQKKKSFPTHKKERPPAIPEKLAEVNTMLPGIARRYRSRSNGSNE